MSIGQMPSEGSRWCCSSPFWGRETRSLREMLVQGLLIPNRVPVVFATPSNEITRRPFLHFVHFWMSFWGFFFFFSSNRVFCIYFFEQRWNPVITAHQDDGNSIKLRRNTKIVKLGGRTRAGCNTGWTLGWLANQMHLTLVIGMPGTVPWPLIYPVGQQDTFLRADPPGLHKSACPISRMAENPTLRWHLSANFFKEIHWVLMRLRLTVS